MTDIVALRTADIEWPEPAAFAPERVLSGNPVTSTVVVEDASGHQLGLWRVEPGEFTTDHVGYIEYIHILSGTGRLVDDAGTVTELGPEVTVLMPSGWKGRWVVDDTIVKVYTIIHP
ncbi:MAG: DUF861 domain-containing protein [Cryobacterium sp.]|nr:DUF861 domain-containing protein [Cryobacterium sp.]